MNKEEINKIVDNILIDVPNMYENGHYNENLLNYKFKEHYDITILTSPWGKDLHLKYLEKFIKISKKTISIQPVAWLSNPFAKDNKNSFFNKFENSIAKHIKDLEIIPSKIASKILKTLQRNNIGIYVCDKDGGYDYMKLSSNEIINKVKTYILNNLCNVESNKKSGYRVRIPFVLINSKSNLRTIPFRKLVFKDGKKDGKWWYKFWKRSGYAKETETIKLSIKFNSEKEAINFLNQYDTDFVKYINNFIVTRGVFDKKFIIWMGNAKHPRTGTTGYIDEWTDEDFYKFFEITEEQQKMIEEFIKNN